MFVLSAILILISSYFLVSMFAKNKLKNEPAGIYLLLIMFAQIIFGFEVLSLFTAINSVNFLLMNVVFLVVSFALFCKNGRCVYVPEIKSELKRVLFALKADKFLCIAGLFFIFFLSVRLFLALFLPVNFGDALSYYFPRAASWFMFGSLNHFPTPDSRELIMPVNFDLLYLWLMMFTKKVLHTGIFSYAGFVLSAFSIYKFVREIGFSVRRSLWSVFIFSSFALVSVETYTPASDLTAGGLLLTALYLYLVGCKYGKNTALFFASLSFALALGVKTTALIAVPALIIPFAVISYAFNRGNAIKKALKFTGFAIFNFLLFSSYNFILNFIEFQNPFSNSEQFLLNSFRGGFMGWLCSVIKYIFMLFDTSGVHDFINFNGFVMYLQSSVLSLFGVDVNTYTSEYFKKYFIFSERISIDSSFLGMTGMLSFVPALIISIKNVFKGKNSKKRIILCSLALFFIASVFVFALTMVYTGYNARYLLTFAVIASPVTVYTYVRKKCFYKFLLTILIILYFINIPVSSLKNILQNSEEALIYSYMIKQKPVKIALMADMGNSPIIEIEKLKLSGIKADNLLPEKTEEYDLSEYNYILVNAYDMTSTYITGFKERLGNEEFYVNNCSYWDMNAMQIYFEDGRKPAMVLCDIPFDYFEQRGFKKIEMPSLKKYVILKNENE